MAIAPIDQFIIDTVRRKRNEIGLTQDDIADAIGVSKGFIGNVESTKYDDKYSTVQLNELAKVFKCSPKDFWPNKPL